MRTYRPDEEAADVRSHVQKLDAKKHVRIVPAKTRLQHGRGRDNLALHAPQHAKGGIPPAKPNRVLPSTRRRQHLTPFLAEASAAMYGETMFGAEG